MQSFVVIEHKTDEADQTSVKVRDFEDTATMRTFLKVKLDGWRHLGWTVLASPSSGEWFGYDSGRKVASLHTMHRSSARGKSVSGR